MVLQVDKAMKGLIIRQPWIDLILSGEKVLEMRSKRTNIRGEIGLFQSGSGLILGTCNLTNCIGPLPIQARDVQRFEEPIPYKHSRGAVVWVNLLEI